MEELAALLAKAKLLQAQGAKPEEIDQWLAYHTNGRASSLAEAEQLAATEAKSQPSKWGLLRPAAQGATFGFADEIAGAAAAAQPFSRRDMGATMGERYKNARNDFRTREAATRADNPKLSKLVDVIGSLAVPIGAAGMGIKAVAKTPGIIASMLRGGAIGAGAGGLRGAGDAPELADVPLNAAAGMAVGAGAGSVLGLASKPLAAAFGGLKNLTRDLLSPEAAIASRTRQLALKTMEDAGLTPVQMQQVLAELEASAPGQTIAADASPTLARALRASVNVAPQLEAPTRELLQRRAAGQASRLAAGAEADMGVTGADARGARIQAKESLPSLGKRLYDPMETAPVTSPAIAEQLQIPEVAQLFNRQIPNPGQPLMFAELQALRGKMADASQAAFRAGKGNEGAFWKEQAQQLTQNIEEVVPGFSEANTAYAGGSAVKGAFANGAKALDLPSSEVHSIVRDIQRRGGREALDAYRMGFLESLTNKLRRMQTNRNVAGQIAAMGEDTEKTLRVLFPSDKMFETYLARAKAERTFASTSNAVLGGSTTAKQATDIGASIADEALAGGARAGLPGMTANVIRAGGRAMMGGVQEQARGNVGKILMMSGKNPKLMTLLQMLQDQSAKAAKQRSLYDAVSTFGAPAAAGSLLAP